MPPTPLHGAGLRRLHYALASLLLAIFALFIPALPAAASAAAEPEAIYSLLNDARAANGLNSLARNSSLDQVAAAWAAQLAAAGVLSHNPNYPSQIPAGWSEAGENVARGQQTPDQMHVEWMNSPGHRANILGNYTDVGVAWLTDASGMTWGVQVFANYPAAVAPAPAAAPAQELVTFALPEAPAEATTETPVEHAPPVAGSPGDSLGPVASASGRGNPVAGAPVEPAAWLPIVLVLAALLVAAAAAHTSLRRRRLAR